MAVGFDVVTIFPGLFHAYLGESILKRAMERELVEISLFNLRDFTTDRHRTVDDYPYGGGSGMVFKVEPVYRALQAIKADGRRRRVILLSPQGKTYTQGMAEALARERGRMVLLCGRYEGVDERVREHLVDEEISIGEYVLTGGELAALVIIDTVARLVSGVLGDDASVKEESFSWGLLEYPHYTRPPDFMGMKVPEVLLSGNHGEIGRWRRREALARTLRRRPELLEKAPLDRNDLEILKELCSERMSAQHVEGEDGPDKDNRRGV